MAQYENFVIWNIKTYQMISLEENKTMKQEAKLLKHVEKLTILIIGGKNPE